MNLSLANKNLFTIFSYLFNVITDFYIFKCIYVKDQDELNFNYNQINKSPSNGIH